MIPAPSYEDVDALLNKSTIEIGGHPIPGVPQNARTVCFLLFDQNYDAKCINDMLANLDFLHCRSGENMYFFLCGVSQYGANSKTVRSLGTLQGAELYHNAEATESFAKTFRKEIDGYRHKVGLDLVLVDIRGESPNRNLDFDSSIYLNLDKLVDLDIAKSPSEIIDSLSEFSGAGKLYTAASFRDEMKAKAGINWIKEFILSIFPNAVKKLAQTQAALGGPSKQTR